MNTKLIGALGEYTAARELREKGYDIFSTNYSTRIGEIDIIAEKKGTLCFVEVKARRNNSLFAPEEAVDFRKRENIKSTAASYINKYKLKYLVRFDIFEVYIDDEDKVVKTNHIINAF